MSMASLRCFLRSSFHNWFPARWPGNTRPNAYGNSLPAASLATTIVGSFCFTARNASWTSHDIRTTSSRWCCKNTAGKILFEIELLAGLNMLCLSSDNHANSRTTNLDRLSHTRVNLSSTSNSLSPCSHKPCGQLFVINAIQTLRINQDTHGLESLNFNVVCNTVKLHQLVVSQMWFFFLFGSVNGS